MESSEGRGRAKSTALTKKNSKDGKDTSPVPMKKCVSLGSLPTSSELKKKSAAEQTANMKSLEAAMKKVNACKKDALTYLDLNNLQLASLPPHLDACAAHVTECYLYGNRFTELPSQIGELPNLEKLGISENVLSVLPDTLSQLQRLKLLDLRHNKFTEVCCAVVLHPSV